MILTLVGKRYYDTIIEIKSLIRNETNSAHKVRKKLGGMNNIVDVPIEGMEIYLWYDGEKEAIVIEESHKTIRSSITWNNVSTYGKKLDDISGDWVHVIYADDLENPNKLLNIPINFSVDFCTKRSREEYIRIIDAASIVFDSRERKHLYENIKTHTPLIFHDEYGCEAVFDGKIDCVGTTETVRNLSVNGAGDIFAAYFIKEYCDKSLREATINTSQKTTNELTRRQNEKI